MSQRSKEDAQDYRYFPEPDIPPLRWTKKYIEGLKENMPELPQEKEQRLINDYSISEIEAKILTKDVNLSEFFENVVIDGKIQDINAKQVANYMINKKPDISNLVPADLIKEIKENSQSYRCR